jgi:hypothetical protein
MMEATVSAIFEEEEPEADEKSLLTLRIGSK